MEQLKTCSKCKRQLPFSAFYQRKNGSYAAACKACLGIQFSAYRKANRKTVNERIVAAKKKNPEKYQALTDAWRARNATRLKEYARRRANNPAYKEKKRAYAKANAEHIREHGKAWRNTHAAECKIRHAEYYKANKDKQRAYEKLHALEIKEKASKRNRAKRAANREQMAASQRARRRANYEKYKAAEDQYREANKDKINARQKAWRTDHRDEINARVRAYVKSNHEKIKAQQHTYSKANAERIKAGLKERISNLSDGYVTATLTHGSGIQAKFITKEMKELQREKLKMYRVTKQLITTIKEKQNGTK